MLTLKQKIKQIKYIKNTPVLKTERLILRPITPKDVNEAFVWLSDKRVNKFMPYSLYKNKDKVLYWINIILPDDNNFHWGIVVKESNLLIGSCSIGPDKKAPGAWGFGYNIRSDYWNQGFTTEATKRMIEFAHKEQGIKDFVSNHAVDNPASGKVVEKCGLVFDHYSEYSTFDGTQTFKAKFYKMHLD